MWLFISVSIHVSKQCVAVDVCLMKEIDRELWMHFIDCLRSADFPAQEIETI